MLTRFVQDFLKRADNGDAYNAGTAKVRAVDEVSDSTHIAKF